MVFELKTSHKILFGSAILIFCLFFYFILTSKVDCRQHANTVLFENYEPACTINNNFMPEQRWKLLGTNYSWCTSSNGTIIPYTYEKISKSSTIRSTQCLTKLKKMTFYQNIIVFLGYIYLPVLKTLD